MCLRLNNVSTVEAIHTERHTLVQTLLFGPAARKLKTNYVKESNTTLYSSLNQFDRKKPPPRGGFPTYYVPSSRTVCKRTPLEGFVPGSSRGVLLHTVLMKFLCSFDQIYVVCVQ